MALIRHHLISNIGLSKPTLKHRDCVVSVHLFQKFCLVLAGSVSSQLRGDLVHSSQDLMNSPFSQLQAPFPWTLTEASVPSEWGKSREVPGFVPAQILEGNPKSSSVPSGHGTRLIPAPARAAPAPGEMSSSLIPCGLSQQRAGFGHPAPRGAAKIQCTARAVWTALVFISVMCKSSSLALGPCVFQTNTATEALTTPESLQSTRQREKRDLTMCTNLNSHRRHKPFKHKFIWRLSSSMTSCTSNQLIYNIKLRITREEIE